LDPPAARPPAPKDLARPPASAPPDGAAPTAAAAASPAARWAAAAEAAELYAAYAVVAERAARPFKTADDLTLLGAARWARLGRVGPRGGPAGWSQEPDASFCQEAWRALICGPSPTPPSSFLASRLLARGAPAAPPPPGVSLATALLALARAAEALGGYKTARLVYGRLQVGSPRPQAFNCRHKCPFPPFLCPPTPHTVHPDPSSCQALALPPEAQAEVDLASVVVRARPFADAEELAPACPRCGAASPLVNVQACTGEGLWGRTTPFAPTTLGCASFSGARPTAPPAPAPPQGDACVACGAAFQRSPLTWEVLPAVEFELEEGIGEAEALVGGWVVGWVAKGTDGY
jgi:hypothetical protein